MPSPSPLGEVVFAAHLQSTIARESQKSSTNSIGVQCRKVACNGDEVRNGGRKGKEDEVKAERRR